MLAFVINVTSKTEYYGEFFRKNGFYTLNTHGLLFSRKSGETADSVRHQIER